MEHEGEVLEAFVSDSRDKAAALRFLKKLLKRHVKPEGLATDGLKSYGAALKELGAEERQVTGLWQNNRTETFHPFFRQRERALLRFRPMRNLQKFVPVHSSGKISSASNGTPGAETPKS